MIILYQSCTGQAIQDLWKLEELGRDEKRSNIRYVLGFF